jgi:uncharacterized protein YgbK (DUF1537 family)
MKIGVVADDITGANDIGGLFVAGGYTAHVYPAAQFSPADLAADGEPDVCILDTNSRLDRPDEAYAKVAAATGALRAAGCTRFFNKTCSVFRGNIGPEFDAMLDALDEESAVVVLGFPRNGRLTVDGVHYVHGARLEHSPFRSDPIHPTTRSDLVGILAAQTRRPVTLVDHRVVAAGPAALRAALDAAGPGYCIVDVDGQAALATIARAVAERPVLCGSSALAEELPAVWGPSEAPAPPALPPPDRVGTLCVAGSLTPQTAAQVAHLRERGALVAELNTVGLFEAAGFDAEVGRVAGLLAAELGAGRDGAVQASAAPELVAATRAAGARRGLGPSAVGRLVSAALAEVAGQVVGRLGGRRLVVAGGETSAAVCGRLGVRGLRVLREIQPGLPACVTLGARPMLLVLKSGSFGSPAFLEEAIAYLRETATP